MAPWVQGTRHGTPKTSKHGENLSGNGVIFWGIFSRFEKGLASGVIDYRLFLWLLRQKPVLRMVNLAITKQKCFKAPSLRKASPEQNHIYIYIYIYVKLGALIVTAC